MAAKFPLITVNSTRVRLPEELREHFDLTTALAYYDNGCLVKTLAIAKALFACNGNYPDQANQAVICVQELSRR